MRAPQHLVGSGKIIGSIIVRVLVQHHRHVFAVVLDFLWRITLFNIAQEKCADNHTWAGYE